jgi:hypothetical protein
MEWEKDEGESGIEGSGQLKFTEEKVMFLRLGVFFLGQLS